MSIWCRQRRQMCSLVVVPIYFLRPTAGIFPQLGPNEKMRRRLLNHMKHVHYLVRIAAASERFFRFAKQRAPIFGPFWSSHDIPASKTMIVQCSPKKHTIFSQYFGGLKLQTALTEMLSARFVSEGISDLVEVEAAIDDWLDAGSIDCPHKIHLMPMAADDQPLEPRLFGHQ